MTTETAASPDITLRRGSAWEVFRVFLRLGLTSFGGPVAHLGYFREEFVVRRRWIDDHAYADLVARSALIGGTSAHGSFLPSCDVRYLVDSGGITDITRTSLKRLYSTRRLVQSLA